LGETVESCSIENSKPRKPSPQLLSHLVLQLGHILSRETADHIVTALDVVVLPRDFVLVAFDCVQGAVDSVESAVPGVVGACDGVSGASAEVAIAVVLEVGLGGRVREDKQKEQ